VIDLKIEDFKPEFAGKMNFYLSAVDDHLRHADDKPSIGLILCKGRNEVIVEYALRDTNKPMGVSHYLLSAGQALPNDLLNDLPTAAELSKEFPLMSLVKLRIEIERALTDIAEANGLMVRTFGVRRLVEDLQRAQLLPESAAQVLRVVNDMNRAVHGADVDAAAAEEAIQIGNRFLAELRG
jgi:YhcG PDDEXK nuclease domain